MAEKGKNWGDYIANLLIRGILRVALLLPYHIRIPLVGWLMARLIAPLIGYTKRIRANLAYTCPELDPSEVARICKEVPNNAGRNLIELYSNPKFIERHRDTPLNGDGVAALAEAHSQGRPVVLVTGHFGNYDAARVALLRLGYKVGAVYMPMNNRFFNAHYETAIQSMGGELFARGGRGLRDMVRFLRGGGMACLIVDQHMVHGAPLQFFGKTAPTALSAAEMALKYDALLVPIYGIRAENGLDFDVQVDAPIAHTDAKTMTQALNDSLEVLVRQHMGQWLWIHRRWKPARQRTLAAAKIDP